MGEVSREENKTSYIKKGKWNNGTRMIKRGRGWEGRVEEGVWAGLTNTKDYERVM